ncbi:MAG TPA: LamG-like jellyroll fold domain-containing protein [Saprospiraceae bacterium]|nr:LamG-like jellyroll fold domain-containing protein [Saprospiraceae bacterium]
MKSISFSLILFLAFSGYSQTTLDSGLIAYYPFCESATDYSGHGNHGSINGGVTFVDDKWGHSKSAAHFNGTNAFIRVPASVSLDTLTKSITVACWFYTKSYDSKWASLISKSNNTSALRQYSIIYDKDGLISFSHTLVATHLLELNQWYHMAVTYQDTIAKCYVDGILVDSNTMANQITSTNFPLYIGADPHVVTEYHHGMLDDVRIYNRALSAAEVSALYLVEVNCNTISTHEAINEQNLTAFPNPTTGLLTFDWKVPPPDWTLQVFDLQGKLIQTIASNNPKESINISEMPPGLYVIRIDTKEDVYVIRAIKR